MRDRVRLRKDEIARVRLGISVLAVGVIALCSPALSSDSTMFRGNPRHSGVYASDAELHSPRVKWKFHTDGYVISSPAVASDLVYVGSTDGKLYALDHVTGRLRWKFATQGRVVSSPAVSNGLVYFGSYDGNFYAVDAANGKLKWKFRTAGERRFEAVHLHGAQPAKETMPDPFDVFMSSPAVFRDVVFFGSGDGNVYALNALSGALRWRFKTGNVVHASPAVDNGTVFIGSWDSYFYAIDASTGQERWRFKTGEDPDIHNQVGIQSSAAVAGGMVYFGCRDSHLYALDAGSGRLRWSFPTHGSWVVGSPAVAGPLVYFATSDSALLFVVRSKNGEVVFSRSFNGWPMFSSPAIAGRMLYVGSASGTLTALDLDTRGVAWTFKTDGSKRNARTYTKPDGTPNYAAAFRSDFYDDIVVGHDKMMTVGAILSSPVIVDHMVYVGSTDGNLYALM
jgi:outer membrane protein assembly factor BamB